MEWVVAISWQLRGRRDNYGISVVITGRISDHYFVTLHYKTNKKLHSTVLCNG